jgi:4-amino-4-deoxy-L-arabinose transferase-like glycosyltransferase
MTAFLWSDESFTTAASQQSSSQKLEITAADMALLIYYINFFIWIKIFSHSEIPLGNLSILSFLAIVFFVYLIAKKIWNIKTAVIVSSLAFFNPFLFAFALESKMYAILVFNITLSFFLFYRTKLK